MNSYLLFKSLHLIAVISWMAGLLYLPRIFVYHAENKNEIIPNNIITKEPTAELKEDQKDSDSLPPYDVLDKVLYHLVEKESSVKEIVDQGFDKELVKRIQNLLYNSEYKRRQAAPGVKISERNFGYDRRYPITNAFRDMEN